jgi:hypothetical protein
MTPLFVSYFANYKGEHRGWLVFNDVGPIETGADVEKLAARVEVYRNWPPGAATVVSFTRLEREEQL